MKRLMMLSISILCLSVSALIGFHLGVQKAEADFNPNGFIVGGTSTAAAWVLTSSGEVWSYPNPNGPWTAQCRLDVQEPISNIKLWMLYNFVTNSDEVWQLQAGVWTNIGTPPGGGVTTNPTTWGQLKNKYQEEK